MDGLLIANKVALRYIFVNYDLLNLQKLTVVKNYGHRRQKSETSDSW